MSENNQANEPVRYITSREKYVMDQFQKHFINFAIWSRALIIALKFELPNTEDIYKRLLEEPNDVRNLMATYLGLENPDLFKNNLSQLITDFRSLAEAILTNDTQQANESFGKLYQTTNDMSEFFYNLNPSSSLEQWHNLFHEYVEMLYYEIYTIVSGNYSGDIELFDKIINQSYLIADYMSNTLLPISHPVSTTPLVTTPPAATPPTGATPLSH